VSHEVKAIVRSDLVESVIQALQAIPDMPGVIVSTVRAHGRRADGGFEDLVMSKVEAVVPTLLLPEVLDAIRRSARTGRPGDGKIFVSDIRSVVRIRTGDSTEGVR